MKNPGFSMRPLYAGTMVGLRVFRFRSDGSLTGYYHQIEWTPGENKAICLNDSVVFRPNPIIAGGQPLSMSACDIPHEVSLDCTCGFYAYHSGLNEYDGSPNSVAAVVEGYGHMVVGDRGFRAGKARILALIVPPGTPLSVESDEEYAKRKSWRDLSWWDRRKRKRRCQSTFHMHDDERIFRSIADTCTCYNGLREERDAKDALIASVVAGLALPLAKVRAKYPGVPVFSSVEEATKAFPLSTFTPDADSECA